MAQSADLLVEIGFDGLIRWINDAVQPLLGRSPESFRGRSFIELIVPEDREVALAAFQKVTNAGAELRLRFRVPRIDGLLVAFEVNARPATIDGERTIVASMRDVTQQSAEAAVAEARNALYRSLVESGDRPATILDREGRVLFSNRAFTAAFGAMERFADLLADVPDTVRRALQTRWHASTRAGAESAGAGDFCRTSPDGRRVWYAAIWEPIPTEGGERRFAVFYEDVTPRKRIEIALRSIADGLTREDRGRLDEDVEIVAQALDLERFVVALLDPGTPGHARIHTGVAGGVRLRKETIPLEGLPEAQVAAGEVVVHPSGLTRIMPEVGDRLSPDYESFAGVPIRGVDGGVVGYVGGYGRAPIADADLARLLLRAFAAQAGAVVDRQRADREIRSAKDRFHAWASQRQEVLLEIDEQGLILYASEGARSVLGCPPARMVDADLVDWIHPDDRATSDAAWTRLFGGDPHAHTVSRFRHQDGRWLSLDCRASAFKTPDGARRALILAREESDRQADQLGRDLLYRVVQAGRDLVFVCDPDGRLLFANAAAARRIRPDRDPGGEAPTGVEGRAFETLLTKQDALRLRSEILPQLTPTEAWSGELSLRGPEDGEDITTEATLFLFEDAARDRHYLGVTLRDIVARRRVETALAESRTRLAQAQKMEAVGRLAGGIAHDFNNLLTAIIGYSDLVIGELGEGHVARSDAEEILRAAERAGGLTRQLLAFSRRQVLQAEPIDLNRIVADVDRMMRRLIGDDIELHTLQEDGAQTIMADPGQIEQVIVNLVVNARDAMPRGGRLTVETTRETIRSPRQTASGQLEPGDYAILRVSDTGVGMDPETVGRIFEPFFTTKDVHEGTGLGLSTVYGIVSQSGGQIDLETRPGEGSRFSVYLPVSAVEVADPASDATGRVRGGRETILLLEDFAPIRTLVQRTLESAGYRVLPAESATAALRYCSRHDGPIELLVADVVLPKAAGPEIARRARELRPGLPVLYMSGFSGETLLQHGLDPARDPLIEKPFAPSAILARVRAVLDQAAQDAAGPSIPRPPA